MTHKQARITKGFARQQCEAFADEFGMSYKAACRMLKSATAQQML